MSVQTQIFIWRNIHPEVNLHPDVNIRATEQRPVNRAEEIANAVTGNFACESGCLL
jgi:hypothetical protein